MTINALAEIMVMDRTTLGRNILPLQREGLIDISTGSSDRRSKEMRLTVTGIEKVREARRAWAEAQRQFESAFGRGIPTVYDPIGAYPLISYTLNPARGLRTAHHGRFESGDTKSVRSVASRPMRGMTP